MLIDQADDVETLDALLCSPPAPELAEGPDARRRSRRLSRFAALTVAFLAAVLMLVGPWNTEDKALAVSFAPIIAEIGVDAALPESILAFSPPGFAITAAAALAWVAWDNRDTITKWSQKAWCWITNCDPTNNHSVSAPGTLAPEVRATSPYITESWSVSHGGTPGTLKVDSTGCVQKVFIGSPPADLCSASNEAIGSGALLVVCTGGAGASYGAVLVGRGSTSGSVSFPTGGGSFVTPPAPNTFSSAAVKAHSDVYVCPGGYEPARAEWWNTTAGSKTDLLHGYYSAGVNVPTDTREDANCKRPDGTTYVVQGNVSTDPGDGSVGFTVPKCAAGDTLTGYTMNTRVTGDTAWLSTPVPLVADPSQVANYGDCLNTDGTSNGQCHTAVFVDGTECKVVAGNAYPPQCAGWQDLAADPSQASRVVCKYGSHVMPLTDCDALAHAYNTGWYSSDDGGSTWYSSDPNGNPSAGGGSTGSNPAPDPGGTTTTGPGGDPNTNDGSNPDANCWGGMISWNPLDWVYTPVKCVMVWAFVPDQGYVAQQMAAVGTTWDGTVVGKWLGAAGDLVDQVANVPGDDDCLGPPWTINAVAVHGGEETVHPFSTCDDPVRTVALVTRTGLTVVVWLGVVLVGVKLLGSAVGLNLSFWGRDDGDDGAAS